MNSLSLAERAKLARLRAGYANEAAAAKAIKCSRTLVISWENGEAKSIGGKYLMGAAKVYRVNPYWLTLEADNDGYPWTPEIVPSTSQPERSIASKIGDAVRLTQRVFDEAIDPIPEDRYEEVTKLIEAEVSERDSLRSDTDLREAARAVLTKLRGTKKWTKGKRR